MKKLSFSNVNWKNLSDSVRLGEGPSIFISDKIPRVVHGVAASLFVAQRMDWILATRTFLERVVISRVHLEINGA